MNKEAKKEIPAQKIVELLTTAMSKTVEVEVTTCIDNGDLDDWDRPTSEIGFYTHINLLEGQINREINLKLIDNPTYRELQLWHIEQVQESQGSLVANLASLQAMFNLIN